MRFSISFEGVWLLESLELVCWCERERGGLRAWLGKYKSLLLPLESLRSMRNGIISLNFSSPTPLTSSHHETKPQSLSPASPSPSLCHLLTALYCALTHMPRVSASDIRELRL